MKSKILLKIISLILPLTLLVSTFCGCNTKAEMNVMALKGPTGMGLASLMEKSESGQSKQKYNFTIASDPSEVSAAVISGSVDIAMLPINLAATLYNKGVDISVFAINTKSVLYLLENGNEIQNFTDLRGKTIYSTGQGSTPEYILKYLLTESGIDPTKDVTIEFLSDHAELASKLATNKVAIGVLPEPNVTAALQAAKNSDNSSLRKVMSLGQVWGEVTNYETSLIQGVCVVQNKFLQSHPDQVSAFIKEYNDSINYVKSNNKDAGEMIAKFGILPNAVIAANAISGSQICCVTGDYMKFDVSAMIKVLYDANPKSVGGAIPGDNFYAIID